MSRTEDTRRVILNMVKALNVHVIDGQESYWHDLAAWRGAAGCGVKASLRAFKDGWQRPFLAAFPDKLTTDEVVLADGEYAAAFGKVEATHAGEFLGLPGDGKRKTLRYMDFWRVKDGKIVENWVMIDIVDFFRQSGIDLLDGKGWDDRGEGYAAVPDCQD